MTSRSYIALALVLLPGRAPAQTPCAPATRVGGDPALVGPVVDLLRERGVPLGASECGEIVAVVGRTDAGRVRVSVTDSDGRGVERVTEDVESTATLIESFARSDVSAPLLAARAAPPEPGQTPDREAPPVIQTAQPAIVAAPERRIEIAAAADLGLTSDGAVWTALRAQGCVHIGRVCVGTMLRYADDTDRYGDSAELVSTRWALDLLVLADVPFRLGGFRLVPGVGLGLTTVRSEREIGEEVHEDDTSGMNARAHVAAGADLGGAWSLELDVAGGFTPFARERLGPSTDRIAGAPRTQGWLGLVLVYGGL